MSKILNWKCQKVFQKTENTQSHFLLRNFPSNPQDLNRPFQIKCKDSIFLQMTITTCHKKLLKTYYLTFNTIMQAYTDFVIVPKSIFDKFSLFSDILLKWRDVCRKYQYLFSNKIRRVYFLIAYLIFFLNIIFLCNISKKFK